MTQEREKVSGPIAKPACVSKLLLSAVLRTLDGMAPSGPAVYINTAGQNANAIEAAESSSVMVEGWTKESHLDNNVGALNNAPELAPDLQVLLKGRQHQPLRLLDRRQRAPPRQERCPLLRVDLLRALLLAPWRPPWNLQPVTSSHTDA